MIENKTNINWLVSIYPTLSKKIYKTRICEVYDLAFFNLQIKKNKIKMIEKRQKRYTK